MATQIIGGVTSVFTGVAAQIYYLEQNLLPLQVYMNDFDSIVQVLDRQTVNESNYKRRLFALRARYRDLIEYDKYVTVRTATNTYHAFEIKGYTTESGYVEGAPRDVPEAEIASFRLLIYDEDLKGTYEWNSYKDEFWDAPKSYVFRGNYKPLSPLHDLPIKMFTRMNNSASDTLNLRSLLNKWNNVEYVYLAVKALFEEIRTLMVLSEPRATPMFKQYKVPE